MKKGFQSQPGRAALRYEKRATAVLRTGVAGCPIKNESLILTETNPVECFLDQNRPPRGAGGVRFIVRAKPEISLSPKDAKLDAKIEEPQAGLILGHF